MREWVMVVVVAIGCGGGDAGVDAPANDAPPDVAIDADEGTGFRVEVKLAGVRDPMPLVLHDNATDSDQSIVVTEDGSVRFPRRLADTSTFRITPGGSQLCIPGSIDAAIAGADALVTIDCDGLVDLETFSASTTIRLLPRFDPRLSSFAGDHPLLSEPTDSVAVTAAARYSTASVATVPAAPTVATTQIQVTVTHAPFTPRTYSFTPLRRNVLQEAYGKASDTVLGAKLGGAFRINAGIHAASIGASGIAISGDTIVAGADTGQGAAYVYRRTGTRWKLEAKLATPVGTTGFGSSVGIDGDTIVVGAYLDGASGAAYVFSRTGTMWQQVAVLRPTLDNAALFGAAVAIAGSTIVVGAPHQGGANPNGEAFVYRDVGGTWTFDRSLLPSPATPSGQFGSAVAVSGTTIAVGAPFANGALGGVYVFAGAQVFSSAGIGGGGQLGSSIGLDGNLMAVGAPFEAVAGKASAGTVRVFRFVGASWTAVGPPLISQSGAAFDHFGSAVAVDRDHVIVGAPDDDSGGALNSGAVFFFRCGGSGACPVQEGSVTFPNGAMRASNPEQLDKFGSSVAVDGDTFVAGAPDEDSNATGIDGNQGNNTAVGAGAMYVLR